MNRPVIFPVLLVLLVGLVLGAPAGAANLEGPRLAVVKFAGKRLELVTVNRNGGQPVRLAGGGWGARPLVDFFLPVAWSPDGEWLAFSGIVGFLNGDGAEPIRKLFLVRAGGTGLRPIPKTTGGSGPVFSPDGRTVAFTRSIQEPSPTTVGGKRWEEFEGSSIWTVDLVSGVLRQLTPWRPGLEYVATSFSPDGSSLLASLDDSLTIEPQPVVLRLDGSLARRITDDGHSAVYSPDGSRIAFVRRIEAYGEDRGEDTDLFVVNADGTGLRRLTRTPGRIELPPNWDPSGERLAYVRLPLVRSEDAPFGYGNALMQINSDGTCQTKIAAPRFSFFFAPAWQPGLGRGAGRIEC